ncbi:S9 family peptidase [Haladaptatus sp. DYSN1]|uniref:alpha/beta hydrolase family protein n=1 Tax=unclassified Haladaptatus TaxID=2622732 RepID=UPI00240581FA|nr:alpha/beta hydrolase [Haladaptatus sp. DYSN1]
MTGKNLSRRRLLVLSGSALAVPLAGCSSQGGADDATTSESEADDGTTTTQTAAQTTAAETEAETDADTEKTTATPEPASFEGADVTFTSTADAEIEGTLFGSGDCGVVMVPQINLDRESWKPQAQLLAAAGYTALPIDERDDPAGAVLGAVSYLKSKAGVSNVVLVGGSSGGEAVVHANAQAEDGAVAGVMGISAAGGVDVAPQLQGRKLFVVGKDDDQRFVDTAKQLHENASDPKRLVMLESDAHAQRIFESPHADTLTDLLVSFVEESCAA